MNILPNTVINFHGIYDVAWMNSVFTLLKQHYNIVPINELENFYCNGYHLKNVCHITFDDGDESFYNNVLPLLKKHQINASIYVSPRAAHERLNFWFQEIRGYDESIMMHIIRHSEILAPALENAPSLMAALHSLKLEVIWKVIHEYQRQTCTQPKPCMNMTPEQLRDLHRSGFVAIGAHTLNHPILSNENDATSEQEINKSIEDLESILNSKVKYFAYPNGVPCLDYGEREIKQLKKCGIKLAFSTEKRSLRCSDDPLSIPRNGLSYGKKQFVLMKLIAGSRWHKIKRIIKGNRENDYRTACKEMYKQNDATRLK